MKDEVRDFTVPIRMTFDEKNTILAKAKKAGKNLSQFMRDCAIGCEMKEKPDEKIIRMLTKEMRDIEITIRNLGREAHNVGFIDERILEKERQKWNNLIIETKQKLL